MLTGWRAVTTLICLVLILSFGVRVLKQWIALRKIGGKNVTILFVTSSNVKYKNAWLIGKNGKG